MASSIQLFGGRAEVVDDLELLALIALINDTTRSTPISQKLTEIISRWRAQSGSYGPGTIDLELDSNGWSVDTRLELIALLEKLADHIETFGSLIPAPHLNSRSIAPGVVFFDFPVESLKSAIGKLRQLFSDDSRSS